MQCLSYIADTQLLNEINKNFSLYYIVNYISAAISQAFLKSMLINLFITFK